MQKEGQALTVSLAPDGSTKSLSELQAEHASLLEQNKLVGEAIKEHPGIHPFRAAQLLNLYGLPQESYPRIHEKFGLHLRNCVIRTESEAGRKYGNYVENRYLDYTWAGTVVRWCNYITELRTEYINHGEYFIDGTRQNGVAERIDESAISAISESYSKKYAKDNEDNLLEFLSEKPEELWPILLDIVLLFGWDFYYEDQFISFP